MANRLSSQRLTVVPFLQQGEPVVLEENVVKGVPIPVVPAANHHWEIVARGTVTARPPSTHDWWRFETPNRKRLSCQC
jgi:hypothetical protein